MATLSLYYAQKIRGAVFKAADNLEDAGKAMEEASKHWLNYTDLMDKMYSGMDLQRCRPLINWHMNDSLVVEEYKKLQQIY